MYMNWKLFRVWTLTPLFVAIIITAEHCIEYRHEQSFTISEAVIIFLFSYGVFLLGSGVIIILFLFR